MRVWIFGGCSLGCYDKADNGIEKFDTFNNKTSKIMKSYKHFHVKQNLKVNITRKKNLDFGKIFKLPFCHLSMFEQSALRATLL